MTTAGNFRSILTGKIDKSIADHAEQLIESRRDSIHEVGIQRGYLMALREIKEMMNETAREMNGA